MRVQEEIKLEIKKGFEVIVNHDGINPYEEWKKESKDALKDWVVETIDKGDKKGWLPFANFEATVEFDLT